MRENLHTAQPSTVSSKSKIGGGQGSSNLRPRAWLLLAACSSLVGSVAYRSRSRAIRDAVADGVVQHELLSEAISDRTGNLLAGKAAH
jgi:hypothetical protein